MIDVDTLIACGVHPTQARLFALPVTHTCRRFGIETRPRIAAFLAQVHHESQGFTRLEENLYYTTPERIRQIWPTRVSTLAEAAKLCRRPSALASKVYANRMGNGEEASGDGWKYRGRGLIQITGRDNYASATRALDIDYVGSPELVARIDHACLTAGWYWTSVRGNELADSSQIDLITRQINGAAMVGADARRSRFDENLRVLA